MHAGIYLTPENGTVVLLVIVTPLFPEQLGLSGTVLSGRACLAP